MRHQNKWNAHRTVVDGIAFDSKAEAERYGELGLLQKAGKISSLEIHPRFQVLEDEQGKIAYEADFMYVEDGNFVVEDVKGGKATQTQLWRLKWRLARQMWPQCVFRVVER